MKDNSRCTPCREAPSWVLHWEECGVPSPPCKGALCCQFDVHRLYSSYNLRKTRLRTVLVAQLGRKRFRTSVTAPGDQSDWQAAAHNGLIVHRTGEIYYFAVALRQQTLWMAQRRQMRHD